MRCRAGYGRTGTMLACYLVAVEGYSAADVITETRRRSWSIETEQQEQAVFDFERHRIQSKTRDRGGIIMYNVMIGTTAAGNFVLFHILLLLFIILLLLLAQ